MKKSSFFGYMALASVVAYFYYSKNEQTASPSLKGINIDIDPDKLLDSALAYKQVREDYREPIKNVANKVINKLMSR